MPVVHLVCTWGLRQRCGTTAGSGTSISSVWLAVGRNIAAHICPRNPHPVAVNTNTIISTNPMQVMQIEDAELRFCFTKRAQNGGKMTEPNSDIFMLFCWWQNLSLVGVLLHTNVHCYSTGDRVTSSNRCFTDVLVWHSSKLEDPVFIMGVTRSYEILLVIAIQECYSHGYSDQSAAFQHGTFLTPKWNHLQKRNVLLKRVTGNSFWNCWCFLPFGVLMT